MVSLFLENFNYEEDRCSLFCQWTNNVFCSKFKRHYCVQVIYELKTIFLGMEFLSLTFLENYLDI